MGISNNKVKPVKPIKPIYAEDVFRYTYKCINCYIPLKFIENHNNYVHCPICRKNSKNLYDYVFVIIQTTKQYKDNYLE